MMFLLGINYEKFKGNYSTESKKILQFLEFIELADALNTQISKKGLSDVELSRTYAKLYEQKKLNEVLDLIWLRRYKKQIKFDSDDEEMSLMIKKDKPVGEQNKKAKHDNPKSYFDSDSSSDEEMPQFVKMAIVSTENKKVVDKNEDPPKGDLYQELLRLESQKHSEENEEETQMMIKRLQEEDERQMRLEQEKRKRDEEDSIKAAQKLEQELIKQDEEEKKMEEEKNKPECKICFDTIEFQEIIPLS
jgi:hypothetical protein